MNALTTVTPNGDVSAMLRLADLLANSTMVPKDYQRNPGNVFVAIQWGAEVGLGPMQAMQNIAVINGRPSIWGDAAAALVKGHPAYEWMREGVDGDGDERTGWCEIKRRGHEPERRRFGVKDARKAGLWGKSGPWTQYPDRMLQLRARGFALRDVFPDALRGVITAEEATDIPPEPPRSVVGVVVPDQPALAAPERHAMDNPHTMQSFTLAALDDQLSQFWEVEELNSYLNQEAVQKAKARAEKAGRVAKWDEIVAAHYARIVRDDDQAREPGEGE